MAEATAIGSAQALGSEHPMRSIALAGAADRVARLFNRSHFGGEQQIVERRGEMRAHCRTRLRGLSPPDWRGDGFMLFDHRLDLGCSRARHQQGNIGRGGSQPPQKVDRLGERGVAGRPGDMKVEFAIGAFRAGGLPVLDSNLCDQLVEAIEFCLGDQGSGEHPNLPISASEFGAGAGISQHTDNPQGGQVAIVGRPHPEEYQSWYHEESWKQIKTRPYLYAIWIWSMFDFASDFRGEGDSIDMNDKGLVTFDRKTRKDAFYFYKAQWSNEPVLYLTGRRYVDRAYPATDVRAYSNADTASLTVNGVALGETPCPERICVWKDVRLKPGANIVEANATIHGKTLTDRLSWNGPADTVFRVEAGDLNGRMSGDLRYGSDNFFTGGTSVTLNPMMLRPGTAGPPSRRMTGAGDLAFHKAYREGAFSYDFPVTDGAWTVTLHSFEPDAALAATRTFDVVANGKAVLAEFSPSKAGGAPLVAVAKTFTVASVNGHVKLDFVPRGGVAIVSALELQKAGQ